jgi:hypothetical protein
MRFERGGLLRQHIIISNAPHRISPNEYIINISEEYCVKLSLLNDKILCVYENAKVNIDNNKGYNIEHDNEPNETKNI